MTYPPPPGYPPSYPPAYPPAYGYPVPRSNAAAKRAGIVLLVLGGLAFLFAALVGLMATQSDTFRNAPEMQNNADVQRMLQQLDEAGISIEVLMLIFAGVVTAYAIVAVVMAVLLLRSGARGAVIGAMGFVIVVLLFWGLNLVSGLLTANIPGVLMALIVGGIHGLVLVWLMQAVRSPATPLPAIYPPPGYYPPGYGQPMPMQGYQYQAPPPPQDQQKPPAV